MWKAVIRSKIEIYGEWDKRIIAEEPRSLDYSLKDSVDKTLYQIHFVNGMDYMKSKVLDCFLGLDLE